MPSRVQSSIPPDLLRIIDRMVRQGDFTSREAFVQEAVRRMASRLYLEELQRRHGEKGKPSRQEEQRIAELA